MAAVFVLAVTQNSFAQDSAKQSQSSQLLSLYYNIKNALVTDDANAASLSAQEFIKALNSTDSKAISESNISALLKDANSIAETKDIKHQREHFTGLSSNMVAAVKAGKLTDQPVYQAYCPMKKAYWLSKDKTIKNPYFGSAMLTCGKVVETINQ
ncbi:DUF3347 domain-containing protein [Ilyomonas limi]|uniref:DUF3347 domain-containing protein n=1 Tax=Ilyomonas limi TaxID=2575867 RepID=A0A4U3KZ13_9BACT|nr:DUF3347 domain-containing protein [Ilyomonas limi]